MKKGFVVLLLFLALGTLKKTQAQETRFKAIMLYQFTKLVGWPNLVTQPSKAFTIGVYGDSRVYRLTRYYAKGKKVGSHPIIVKYFATAKEISNCEILYISAGKTKYLPVILKRIGDYSTLITTSRMGALRYGAVANFVIVDGYMKVEINRSNALKRKLQISYQLRRAAVNVKKP